MTERRKQLHTTADEQIAELIALLPTVDEASLRLPCPGREKLGDGTLAAAARHTADNYQRIAAFVQTSDRMSGVHEPTPHGGHRSVDALGTSLEAIRAVILTHHHTDHVGTAERLRSTAGARVFVGEGEGLDNAEPRTPQATTPTTFRQWCEDVLKPAVLA